MSGRSMLLCCAFAVSSVATPATADEVSSAPTTSPVSQPATASALPDAPVVMPTPLPGTTAGPDAFSGHIFDLLSENLLITTGRRKDVTLSQAPTSVWVIDRRTIESTAAASIGDLLKLVPNVTVFELTAGQSEVVIRGFNVALQNRVLFLIDGRNIQQDFLGITDLFNLPVDFLDLERIEVTLGPASTLYGANAFTGVVNLITRGPVTSGYRVRAQGGGGIAFGGPGVGSPRFGRPNGLATGYAEWSQNFSGVGIAVSAGGNYLPTHSVPQDYYDQLAVPKPMRHFGGNVAVDYKPEKWNLRAQFSAAVKDGSLIAFYRAPIATQDYSLTLNAERSALLGTDDSLSVSLWVRRLQTNYTLVLPPLPDTPFKIGDTSGELLVQYTSPRFFGNRLIAGFQLRLFNLEWQQIDPTGRFQQFYGLYVEDEYRPIKNLAFTLGARLETREARAFKPFSLLTFNPRAAIVYQPAPGHSLRLEYVTAFRNPTPIETSARFTTADGTVELVSGDPTISAEENKQVALGYQGRFKWFRPRFEAFYSRMSRAIGARQVEENRLLPQRFGNKNVDYVKYGGTIHLEATPVAGLDLMAQYTLSRGRFLNPGSDIFAASGEQPQHLFGFGARFTYRRLTASLYVFGNGFAQQSDREDLGSVSYTLPIVIAINPQISYALGSKRQWQLFVAGTNVADIRIGGTVTRNVGNDDAEHIGPRIWGGLRFVMEGGPDEPPRMY
ncbi:MAG: TonB-dependent receptor [Deltaproteobacteria bacterium]|nr:TonB-dependent receptor [Deltaproteobacteria bacterium]